LGGYIFVFKTTLLMRLIKVASASLIQRVRCLK